MYTVSLMAAPTRADLGDEEIIGLQRRWDGGHAIWLDRGTAAEFPIPDLPADVEAVRADLDARLAAAPYRCPIPAEVQPPLQPRPAAR